MQWFFDKLLHDNRGFAVTGDDKKEEETLIETGEEEVKPGEGDVEVDLDEPEEEDDTPPKARTAWAAMRAENKELKKLVGDLKTSVEGIKAGTQQEDVYVPPAHANSQPDTRDPRNWTEDQWDDLAKKDWKKAVDLRSKLQAEEIQQQSMQTADFNKVLEDSKQKVLSRHPELNDPNSEKAKIYRNIVVANPEYTLQKKGPMTAMYEMEEYMEKNMGYKREDIIKAELKAREDEAARQNRVRLTSTAGHNISEGNKVTVTKDEMEFCKLQGIDPKLYASNKKKLASSGKGGIQL